MRPIRSIALLVAASPFVSADNFKASCDISTLVVKDNTMRAVCKNTRNESVCSILDLTHCITNHNGYLEPNPDGDKPSYMTNCRNCSNEKGSGGLIVDAPTNIHCECENLGGRFPTTFLELNDFVNNSDGFLACFKTTATRCP